MTILRQEIASSALRAVSGQRRNGFYDVGVWMQYTVRKNALIDTGFFFYCTAITVLRLSNVFYIANFLFTLGGDVWYNGDKA